MENGLKRGKKNGNNPFNKIWLLELKQIAFVSLSLVKLFLLPLEKLLQRATENTYREIEKGECIIREKKIDKLYYSDC